MRINIKKFTMFIVFVAFLWLLISTIIEVPRSVTKKTNVVKIENQLNKLEQQMAQQAIVSNSLLEKMKLRIGQKRDDEDLNEIVISEETEEKSSVQKVTPTAPPPIVLPVLVIACDRVTVQRCLNNLVKFRPNATTFPIIVSQDCNHNATYQVIKSFTKLDPSITVIKQPDQSDIHLAKVSELKLKGYYKIARHFKFALNHVFNTLNYEAAIIVEDDLDISPDFFEYFLGTYPLLLKDSSLWCISAWNDNGKKEVIDLDHPELLHRTDFFPGLGWLLRKEMWLKLAPKWPAAFFDDWLRNPNNIENKSCIRPEISRTYSFGKVGVSKGLFFDMHLRNIQLNQQFVKFTKQDLSYLLKENYDRDLANTIESLPEMAAEEVMGDVGHSTVVRVNYNTARSFQRAAKTMGLMDDFRSGVPRTAYRGIVSCYIWDRRVYLTPEFEWKRYDPTWG